MSQHQMSDMVRLGAIKTSLRAIAPARWTRVHDESGVFVEARGAFGEFSEIARFHPGATNEEIAFVVDAPDHVRFLIGLVDRAIARLRPAKAEKAKHAGRSQGDRRDKNYAAEAAIKCGEPAFKAFLEQQHGLERPLTDARTAQKLRSLLGITTRRALNDDAAAADRWKKLRYDFDQWRKTP